MDRNITFYYMHIYDYGYKGKENWIFYKCVVHSLYIYCTNFENEKMNLYKKMIVSITIIYFIITIISIMKSTYDYKLGNMIDKAFSEKIENEIIRLQNEGIQIHKIGIRYAVL